MSAIGHIVPSLVLKRVLAFGADYLVLAAYAGILFGVTLLINPDIKSPATGQVVGFFTLTLPVYLYFFLQERSATGATLGKRLLGVRVIPLAGAGRHAILFRNLWKFLPWEFAHLGVHWLIHFNRLNEYPPVWVWIALMLPQLVVLAYAGTLWRSRGESSLYDRWAGTKVEEANPGKV